MSYLLKALFVINVKKGWTEEARRAALLKRKRRAKVEESRFSEPKVKLGKSEFTVKMMIAPVEKSFGRPGSPGIFKVYENGKELKNRNSVVHGNPTPQKALEKWVKEESKIRAVGGKPFQEIYSLQEKKKSTGKLEAFYFGTGLALKINKNLREGRPDSIAKETTEAFKKDAVAIPKAVTAYRVVSGKNPADLYASKGEKLKVGSVITDKGFFSTTMEKKYASKYNPDEIANMGFKSRKGATSMIHVKMPKGTKVIAHRDASEAELLLGNGTKFKVVSLKPFTLAVVK